MKILMIHDRYLVRGGEDESTDAEIALLRQHGHEVNFFEMDNRIITLQSPLLTGLEAIWSARAYSEVRLRIRQNKYDLVHIQNFFPLLSPAIHHAAKAENKPIIQALRNYRLFCLNTLFFREQRICEDCMGKFIPWPGVIHRCYRRSFAGSSVEASMLTLHRALKTWERKVDIFLAVSEFVRQKFIQGGFSPGRIIVKPNFVLSDPGPGSHQGNFALFVGRLSAEKGLGSMIRVWESLKNVPIKIVGDGPMLEEVSELSRDNSDIELVGRLNQTEVLDLMKEAKFLIFASEWYEGFPRVIVEAFACGLPVITTKIGSMAGIVTDTITGLHFEAGNPILFSQKVKWAWEHPAQMSRMGLNARKEYELRYTSGLNYEMLIKSYQKAIEHARGEHGDLSTG